MNTLRFLLALARMRRNGKKSGSQLAAYQDKKLRRLLRYAYGHSAYYHRVFNDVGIREDELDRLPLSSFPVMDKEILMEHFDELVTQPDITQEALRQFDEGNTDKGQNFLGKYHIVHSSGSTGTPRYFVYDGKAWEQMLTGIVRGGLWDVSVARFLKWYTSHPRILFIAATDGRYGGAMAVGDGLDGLGVMHMSLDIGTPLSQWTKTVRDFQPNFIIGYPSAIKILGELVSEEKLSVNVNRIFSCGEPLGAGLRRYLENCFDTEVVNFYGASESLALGVELKPEDGMVLFDDLNIIEVEDGQMYLTCLYNYVQPIIRYRISDKLVLRKKTKISAFARADVLLGRDEDVLWFQDKNGNREFLHPLSVEGFCVDGLLDYQFCQTAENFFEIDIQLTDPGCEGRVVSFLKMSMERILQSKGLDYVEFEIKTTDEILPDKKTGKKALIRKAGVEVMT